jgi:hypothetical protein
MNKFEVNKIIEIFHSKDWSDKYDFHNKKWKRNIWLKIGNIEDFNFVKDIINSDLKKINKNYKVSNWITFLIYKEGDFFGRHKDDDFNLIDKENPIYSGGYLLNDTFEGGEFIVGDKKLNVQVGELFIFERHLYHEVKEITKGIRYSLHFAVELSDIKKNKNLI